MQISNVWNAAGSTLAGLAVAVPAITSAMSNGIPTSSSGWINFSTSVLFGVLAAFHK